MMRYAARAEGDVIDMVSGNPDFEPPPALRSALHEYADMDQAHFQYPPSDGLVDLRVAIAERRGVDRDQVVVTHGAGGANYLGMAIGLDRDAGDEAILTDPVYPYYPGKVEMLGGTPRLVPTHPDGSLDVAAMVDAMSGDTALVVLNTPNNPTGAVYDDASVRAVIDHAEANDAIVVVDEVYDRFDFSGQFKSALEVDSTHRIVTGGFSKSMAITGFRVGFAILPERFVDPAVTRNMLTNVAGSRPAQHAVVRALRETPESYYADARDTLRRRIEAFTEALDAAGARYTTPNGGFYVLARFEGVPGTTANAKRLVDEAGVAGMPGSTFGEAYADWLRFAVVTPRAVEAAERLGAYVEA
ncbi:MAG: pyridoxal phosphate-dependent aminotransferase [Halobacteriales archaeon]